MSAPADRELMLFVDDELDGLELRRLLVRLEADEGARSKVAAMRLAGDVLRASIAEVAEGEHPADSIADAVMASLDLSGGSSPTIPTAIPEAALVEPPVPAIAPTSASRVVSLAERRSAKETARPADPAKRIYTLAAVAVAAAAAMALWARSPMSPAPEEVTAASTIQPPVVDSAPPPSLALAPDHGAGPDVEEEEHAEVTAVDFGSRTGSVFYLPSQALAANVVAVVWINDEAPGGSL